MSEIMVVEFWHKGQDSQKFVTLEDFAKIAEQLKEANEVIAFYANRDNYDTHSPLGKIMIVSSDCEKGQWKDLDRPDYDPDTGGKKAREYEKKYMTTK